MAEPQLTPALQQQIQQLQGLSSQLQQVSAQRSQMDAMKSEQDDAITALEALSDDAPVYRNVGSLLVKEPGRKQALDRLKEDQETLEVRIARLQKQESALKEQLNALQQKLQAALPKA